MWRPMVLGRCTCSQVLPGCRHFLFSLCPSLRMLSPSRSCGLEVGLGLHVPAVVLVTTGMRMTEDGGEGSVS